MLFAFRPCVGDTAAPTPREATLDNSLDPLEGALTEVAAVADVADRRPRGDAGEQPRLLSARRGRVRQGPPVHRQIHELLTPEDADVGDLRRHVARQFALQRDVELVDVRHLDVERDGRRGCPSGSSRSWLRAVRDPQTAGSAA